MNELNNIPTSTSSVAGLLSSSLSDAIITVETKHWQIKKLGEIFTIERGGSPRPIEEYITNNENGINWIKIGDTKDVVKYIYQTKERIKPEGAKRSRMVYEDDFILSNSMSFGRPYIMKTQGCIHDGWLVIRKNEMIDSNYLYLILSSSQVYQQFTHLAKGSTVKNLNIQAVKEVVISFPPLPEQLAIVSKIEELLSDLENGKQQLLTAQQQLKVYRQSLLKAAFEGKLTSTSLSEQGVSSEAETKDGELPEGWKWVKLGDFALKITDGEHITPKRTSEGFYLLSARNIQNGFLALDDVDFVPTEEYNRIIKRCNPEPGDILISCSGSIGRVCRVPNNLNFVMVRSVALVKLDWVKNSSKFYEYLFQSPLLQRQIEKSKKATAQANLFLGPIKNLDVIVCSLEEQQKVVEILESKLTVCDKIEETISQSLQQAETLKQSILKKAFEGKLVKPQPTKAVAKPKNEYFYQMQLLALIAKASKQHSIEHGEMTLAKYAYLLDKVYGIPTYYDYNRWHLGPYPPEMKKAINNKQYFSRKSNHIIVVNEDKLLKYTNSYETNVIDAIDDLASIFEKYPVKERADKTELLATVCKVVEDIKTTDITEMRKSMQDWKIELDNCPFKNKAEKFSIEETEKCLKFLVQRGWIAKLINKN